MIFREEYIISTTTEHAQNSQIALENSFSDLSGKLSTRLIAQIAYSCPRSFS
jgi:hypothetical protein